MQHCLARRSFTTSPLWHYHCIYLITFGNVAGESYHVLHRLALRSSGTARNDGVLGIAWWGRRGNDDDMAVAFISFTWLSSFLIPFTPVISFLPSIRTVAAGTVWLKSCVLCSRMYIHVRVNTCLHIMSVHTKICAMDAWRK